MKIEDSMRMYFERKVENVHIEIDVEEAVRDRLSVPIKKRYNTKLVALLAILFITVAAHTAIIYGHEIIEIIEKINPMSSVQFSNEEGESEWSAYIGGQSTYVKEAYEDKIDKIWEEIEKVEGKSYLIGLKDEWGKKHVVIRNNTIKIDEIESINEYAQEHFQISMPDNLIGKFIFHEGEIDCDYDEDSYDYNDVLKEINEDGVDFVVRELEAIRPFTLRYYYFNEDYTANIPVIVTSFEGISSSLALYSSSNDGTPYVHEKVMINSVEVLYSEESLCRCVRWFKDDKLFEIAMGFSYTKEDILNVVEEVIRHHNSK